MFFYNESDKWSSVVIEKLRDAAEQGDVDSQYWLAWVYKNIEKDYIPAIHWYKKAAEQGDKCADYALKTYNIYEVAWLIQAAESGYAAAQFELGNCYYNGIDVDENLVEAFRWYSESAERGNANAQYKLGQFYEVGNDIVDIDYFKAIKWAQKAFERGNPWAQHSILSSYNNACACQDSHLSEIKKYMLDLFTLSSVAAEQGDMRAQCILGFWYQYGIGVDKNTAEALFWYHKSAEQGDGIALFNIGECYRRGDGVEKDIRQAFKLYHIAAEQGNKYAQMFLASCYRYGRWVEKTQKK